MSDLLEQSWVGNEPEMPDPSMTTEVIFGNMKREGGRDPPKLRALETMTEMREFEPFQYSGRPPVRSLLFWSCIVVSFGKLVPKHWGMVDLRRLLFRYRRVRELPIWHRVSVGGWGGRVGHERWGVVLVWGES